MWHLVVPRDNERPRQAAPNEKVLVDEPFRGEEPQARLRLFALGYAVL
ncbi:MAG: hypothetical protein ACKOJF_26045 [Planctomycetaceae bacterium]